MANTYLGVRAMYLAGILTFRKYEIEQFSLEAKI